jgi:hypothetical protein
MEKVKWDGDEFNVVGLPLAMQILTYVHFSYVRKIKQMVLAFVLSKCYLMAQLWQAPLSMGIFT